MTTQQSVAELTEGQTIPKLVRRNAVEYGDLPALTSLDAAGEPTLTWAEFRTEIAAVARGLDALGLRAGERMLIMSASRPEHFVVDLAAAHLAVLSCTAYGTLSPDQIRYVARHSGAPVVVLEGAEALSRWQPVLDDLPALRHVVMIDTDNDTAIPEGDDRFVSLADVRARGPRCTSRTRTRSTGRGPGSARTTRCR